MSLLINLGEVPVEGQSIEREVEYSDILLPSDDGKILGSINCAGQIFVLDEKLARFEGTLTGKILRECVRCLTSFEEDLSQDCEIEFRQSPSFSVTDQPSKKIRKGKNTRKHASVVDDETEDEIDMYPIVDNQIDLLPALREHLILASPLQALCYENCAGLCQACGANLNEGICACCAPVTVSS